MTGVLEFQQSLLVLTTLDRGFANDVSTGVFVHSTQTPAIGHQRKHSLFVLRREAVHHHQQCLFQQLHATEFLFARKTVVVAAIAIFGVTVVGLHIVVLSAHYLPPGQSADRRRRRC